MLRTARRVMIGVLAFAALALIALALAMPRLARLLPGVQVLPPLPAQPPLAPSLAAPAGPLPDGPAGLLELARREGQPFAPVGSGFFLLLADGRVVGVTTAHSVPDLRQPGSALQEIAFALPGQAAPFVQFEWLAAPPGTPRSGADLRVDYVLLHLDGAASPAPALAPDPRRAPH